MVSSRLYQWSRPAVIIEMPSAPTTRAPTPKGSDQLSTPDWNPSNQRHHWSPDAYNLVIVPSHSASTLRREFGVDQECCRSSAVA